MQDGNVAATQKRDATHAEIVHEISVGKDILDLLTGAMYVDPLSIYREYVQNAADAIQEAHDLDLYGPGEAPRVEVYLDAKGRNVTIRDNGVGVPQPEFTRRLTAIGASRKRGTQLRGFRGVGRLSGLGYCRELVFRSRALGDARVSEMLWDGRLLKQLLRAPESDLNLANTIRSIAKVRDLPGEGWPLHFFEVELRQLTRAQNDVLLNKDEIESYLAQVAPVPFRSDFRFSRIIETHLRQYGRYAPLSLFLNEEQIFRPFADEFPVTDSVNDTVSGVDLLEVPDLEDGVAAVGWILEHSYLGSIPKRARVDGIRVRIGDIQIGSSDIFESLFAESRFNGWCIGELHVLTPRIVPNGRRDDFEVNAHLHNLQGHIAKVAKDLVRLCREKSALRNRLKSAAGLAESVNQTLSMIEGSKFPTLREYFVEHSSMLLCQLNAFAAEGVLSDAERQLLRDRSELLSQRLAAALKRKRRSGGPLASLQPMKRGAYEAAIDVVLGASLPMAVRAELADKIIQRAKGKN